MYRREKLTSLPFDKKTGLYYLKTRDHRDFDYEDGSEDVLLKIIEKSTDHSSDSKELASLIKDWPTRYHLSNLRTNIIRALNFLKKESKVLEVGAGCGALTRYMGEHFEYVDAIEGSYKRALITKRRCEDLRNVKVYWSSLQELEFDKDYDVVTLVGVLEYAPLYFLKGNRTGEEACLEMLKHVLTALRDNGCIIVAIENRFGLKYWSGCTEDHTGRLFDGIHGYPERKIGITFCRNEIKKLLEKAQLYHYEIYYPFPDYKLTDTIIREVPHPASYYLHNWIKTPFEDYSQSRRHYFNEALVIRSLVQNEMIYDFANSFLIIASPHQRTFDKMAKPEWIAKRLSTNRIPPFQINTTLEREEGSNSLIIRKKRVTDTKGPEGFINLNPGDSEWIPGDLLLFSLCEALYKEAPIEALRKVFARFHNELVGKFSSGKRDEQGYPLVAPEAIDFLPCNIIVNNDRLLGIDREWISLRPISADYILFRAIFFFAADQYPYIFRELGIADDMEAFIKSIIVLFYPQYDRGRQDLNKRLEEELQSFVSGSPVRFPSFEEYGLIKDPILQREAQINAILNSWSWKITAPLRWLSRKIPWKGFSFKTKD